MDQDKKAMLLTVALVLAVGLATGGFWLGTHHGSNKVVNDGAASAADNGSGVSTDGGLSVNGGSATDLGQLGGGSQTGLGQPGTGSSGTSSASNAPNPSSFTQYDKYKDSSTALFGDIQVGNGATLGANQKATISYKGWLTNGTLFDQSPVSNGQVQPLSFSEGSSQIIPGLQEGVDGMKVGGSRLVIVPPGLGYGSQGQGSIPPNAVLVFQVNLLDVN